MSVEDAMRIEDVGGSKEEGVSEFIGYCIGAMAEILYYLQFWQ